MTVLSSESTSPDHRTHDWFVERHEGLVARLADGLRLQRRLGRPEPDHAEMVENFLDGMRSGVSEPPTT